MSSKISVFVSVELSTLLLFVRTSGVLWRWILPLPLIPGRLSLLFLIKFIAIIVIALIDELLQSLLLVSCGALIDRALIQRNWLLLGALLRVKTRLTLLGLELPALIVFVDMSCCIWIVVFLEATILGVLLLRPSWLIEILLLLHVLILHISMMLVVELLILIPHLVLNPSSVMHTLSVHDTTTPASHSRSKLMLSLSIKPAIASLHVWLSLCESWIVRL